MKRAYVAALLLVGCGAAVPAFADGSSASDDKSNFSHAWTQGRGAVQVEVGDYQMHVGDAEKSIEDCMRAFEGSSTPPSCLSGLTLQRKPPGDVSPR